MIRGLLLLLPLLLLSACISFNEPPQTHYYLLEADDSITLSYAENHDVINVRLVGFPESLDRQQLLLKDQANMVRIINTERWAEPLAENIQAVIRSNLQRHFPNATVNAGIWHKLADDSKQLQIWVNQFIGSLGTETVVELSWQLRSGNQVIHHGRFLDKQKIGTRYQDYVAGLNRSVNNFCAKLSREIAGE